MGKLTAKTGSGNWTPCPEGQYQAVCVDVVDLGWLERFFDGKSTGHKPMTQLVWQVDELNEDDQPFLVFSKRYVLSLDAKANLRKDLDAWFGPKAIEKRIAEDDLETEDFVGKNAYINVVHNEGADGTLYANIGALMPLPKNMNPMTVSDYTRRCDRDDWAEKAPVVSAFDTFVPPRADDMSASNSQRAATQTSAPATPKPSAVPTTRAPQTPARKAVNEQRAAATAALAKDFDPDADELADDANPFADEGEPGYIAGPVGQATLLTTPGVNTAHV